MKEKLSGSVDALNAVQITQKVDGLDTACKTLLKHKELLSVILKYVVAEYKNYSLTEIMDFIEADSITSPEVASGRTNTQISGENTEFSQLNEKTSKFDILFKARNPQLSTKKMSINLIVDIEPQKNYRPGYPIEKRGIYYASRMIASQLPSVIAADADYNNLVKVYSIWICRDRIPKKERYTMSQYSIINTENLGTYVPKHKNYDLMNMAIIRLGDKDYAKDIALFRFLNALFYPENKDSYKKLNEYVDFNQNKQLEKEVEQMSGLGQSVLEEGIEQGIEKGIEQGIEKGIEKGIERGIEQGKIELLISLYQDGLIAKDTAAERLHISIAKWEYLLSQQGK